MGFGLLLIGYFLSFLMSNIHSAFGFAGAYLMINGLLKLKDYKSEFTYALYPAGLFMALSLKDTVLELLSVFGEEVAFFEGAVISTVSELLMIAAVSAFHLSLFLSIGGLAKEIGIEKIRVSSLRNLVFFALYVILCAARFLPVKYPDTFVLYLNLIIMLMQLFWIFLTILLLFSCFRNIADKEKQDKELAEESDGSRKGE